MCVVMVRWQSSFVWQSECISGLSTMFRKLTLRVILVRLLNLVGLIYWAMGRRCMAGCRHRATASRL